MLSQRDHLLLLQKHQPALGLSGYSPPSPYPGGLCAVHGHQDSNLPFESLDCLAQLNSMADNLAKQHLQLAISQNIPSLPIGPLAGESWSCSLHNGSKLTSDSHGPVLFSLSSPLVQEYLSCCQFLPSTAPPWSIGFPLGMLVWPLPLYCLWISKFVSGHSAVGHIMLKHGKWDKNLCPCCGHSQETTRHVISCQDPCMSLPSPWQSLSSLSGSTIWKVLNPLV